MDALVTTAAQWGFQPFLILLMLAGGGWFARNATVQNARDRERSTQARIKLAGALHSMAEAIRSIRERLTTLEAEVRTLRELIDRIEQGRGR